MQEMAEISMTKLQAGGIFHQVMTVKFVSKSIMMISTKICIFHSPAKSFHRYVQKVCVCAFGDGTFYCYCRSSLAYRSQQAFSNWLRPKFPTIPGPKKQNDAFIGNDDPREYKVYDDSDEELRDVSFCVDTVLDAGTEGMMRCADLSIGFRKMRCIY